MGEINWLDAKSIIEVGGIALITLTVFAETGLFFCFFLPGDYLLFSAGLFCAVGYNGTGNPILDIPIWAMCLLLFAAAVIGNYTGYFFGKYLGHKLENRKESFFYKKQYLINTQEAFNKHGGRVLIIGRFLPVIRTFAPILSGMIRMNMKTFTFYNTAGAALWVGLLCNAGYFLGEAYGKQLMDNLHYIILAFIVVTLYGLINSYRRLNRKKN